MTEQERAECLAFAAMIWAYELIADLAPTESECDQLIALAASYGPPKSITTTD